MGVQIPPSAPLDLLLTILGGSQGCPVWTYIQKSGELLRDGLHVGVGYSGYDDPYTGQMGKNSPELQSIEGVGPVPVGGYFIGPPHDTLTHGPFVLPLTPDPGNEMFGRTEFLIHGDSKEHPGAASRGCIIMGFDVRKLVAASGDRLLRVISGLTDEVRVG
jgi:hypothetical protein